MQATGQCFFDMNETAEQLLEQFYAGDDRAFDRLATRLRPQMIALALHRLPRSLPARRELAEDLATEAFMRVLRTKHKPSVRWQQAKGPVSGWLMQIVRNLVVSRLRTKKGRELLGADLETQDAEGRPQAFGAQLQDHRLDGEQQRRDDEALRRRLLRAVDQLPAELRAMVRMKLDGCSHPEIGEQFGVSKSSVTRRLQAAQKELQDALIEVA